ncbi:MAG: endonuclease domain-containing protein [Pseudomonadota bacterium]
MKQKLVPFAKQLRSASTDAERALWRHVRAHRLDGCKFKRQETIGKYIVDFICYEAKLIVELDGGQHFENVSDRQRDEWLNAQGFNVLRFWNNEVLTNIEGVLERVRENLSPSPQPSPTRGEGEKRRGISAGGEGGKRANIGKSQKRKKSPLSLDRKARKQGKSPLSLDGTREHLKRSRGVGERVEQ